MSLAFMRHLGLVAATGRCLADQRGILPEPLASLSLDDLLSLSAKIGILTITPVYLDDAVQEQNRPKKGTILDANLSIVELVSMMEAAHSFISDWPHSADALFNSIADRNPNPATEHPIQAMFGTQMGYRLLSPLKTLDGGEVNLLKEPLDGWLFRERGIYLDGRRRPKVADGGNIGIDIADAMRRLEGRNVNPFGISAWADAGAVEMVGKKVVLASVERTVEKMAQLKSHDLDDAIVLEEWSQGAYFVPTYRRSNVLREILSGVIRIRRDSEGEGLAALMISRGDFAACRSMLRAPRIKPHWTKVSPAETRAKALRKRIENLHKVDLHIRATRVNSLLAQIWPGIPPLDVAAEPYIRCKYIVRHYHGRLCGMNIYSAVDAINLVEQIRGPIGA